MQFLIVIIGVIALALLGYLCVILVKGDGEP